MSDSDVFALRYHEFVSHQRDETNKGSLSKVILPSSTNEYISDRKVILRDRSTAEVISFITDKLMVKQQDSIATKARQNLHRYRSFTAYVLRVLCGLGYKEICNCMFNITISGCCRLCSKGYELLGKDKSYLDVFIKFVHRIKYTINKILASPLSQISF